MNSALYSGKQMWIWEVDQTFGGNVDTMISQGKQMGLSGFLVKAHDGSTVWPQFKEVLGPLKAAGFTVAAWGYVYGNDVLGESTAAQTVIDMGADWYVLDAEQSFDGQADAATQLCTIIRSHYPHLIMGYSPFAFPSDHQTFPYAEFSRFCDVCLPQIYWGEFAMTPEAAVSQSFSELQEYKLPFAPIGQAYGSVTGSQIEEFAQAVHAQGGQGISFWDLQSANSMQLQAVGQIEQFPAPRAATMPVAGAPIAPQSKVPVATAPRGPIDTVTPTHIGASYYVSGMPADVKPNDWFYGAVSDLLSRGIITAYKDGLFKPDEGITRAQAADWLNRLRIYLEQQTGK
ncbi:MAG: S-layer homology domain-containing protein [Acidibacillus sp.]|nr:S-layer homology domain-containing protein [Acidibacillus sp.]